MRFLSMSKGNQRTRSASDITVIARSASDEAIFFHKVAQKKEENRLQKGHVFFEKVGAAFFDVFVPEN